MKSLLLAVGIVVAVPGWALAQQGSDTLLTSGVVKRVDHASGTVVLENGRRVRPRLVMVNDRFAPLSTVAPKDLVFVAGSDLGFEDAQPSALAAPATTR
jgi:hypothetical protein